MINIRKDLIKQELSRDVKNGLIYNTFNLHNSLISKLKNHYNCIEMCENYYDSEPEFDDEEYNMYLDYKDNIKVTGLSFWNMVSRTDELKESGTFSTQKHTKEDIKASYDKVVKMYKDYEEERILFNNWQEPTMKGNWGVSQEYVNAIAIKILKNIRKSNISNKGRFFISYHKDDITIYWYGRDYKEVDYWFIFKRK